LIFNFRTSSRINHWKNIYWLQWNYFSYDLDLDFFQSPQASTGIARIQNIRIPPYMV